MDNGQGGRYGRWDDVSVQDGRWDDVPVPDGRWDDVPVPNGCFRRTGRSREGWTEHRPARGFAGGDLCCRHWPRLARAPLSGDIRTVLRRRRWDAVGRRDIHSVPAVPSDVRWKGYLQCSFTASLG